MRTALIRCKGYQKVLGSLTLGGYDASRLTTTNVTLPFGADDSRSLVVGVQSISATDTLRGDASLLSSDESVVALIDSTVPHLWLPQVVCDNFAQAFNLTYDNTTDLYLVSEDVHSQLTNSNPKVTLHLSGGSGSTSTIIIELPYASFDLEASYPIYENATRYFPIRRAANDTQYTLGRTFLQEAYIIVDYERSQFSVHQAAFQDPMPASDIITIEPFTTSGSVKDKLSGGVIAGIAIGALAGVLFIAGIAWWLLRLRKRRNVAESKAYAPVEQSPASGTEYPVKPVEWTKVQQLEDNSRHELSAPGEKPPELGAHPVPHHFGSGSGTPTSELPTPPARSAALFELPGRSPSARHELPT